MTGGERAKVLALLAVHGPDLDRLCAACVVHLPGISGAGLAVMTTLPARRVRYVSDQVGARVEELQFTRGEGPCVDAFAAGRPVLVTDLAEGRYALRWPAFTVAAVATGVRALFALPLQIGAIRIGVLDLYSDRPGELDGDDLADALVFADAATLLLLAERRPDGPEWWSPTADDRRVVVYQATGMIMVQLGTTIQEAFVRLRARAFAEDRTLAEIADDVVSRRMRFDEPEV